MPTNAVNKYKYTYDASGNVVAQTLTGGVLPPQIVGQPVDQVVEIGNVATFSVVVADATGVTYQWSRSVGTPANFININGATADSLEVVMSWFSVKWSDRRFC
jgi:hypothetical protein